LKKDFDPIVDKFLEKQPSNNAAKALNQKLNRLFGEINGIYMPPSMRGRKSNLKNLGNKVRIAALAASLFPAQRSDIDKLAKIHASLLDLKIAIDGFLSSYG
jgi:hypothetical protein